MKQLTKQIHSDVKKRRFALLLAAGDLPRWAKTSGGRMSLLDLLLSTFMVMTIVVASGCSTSLTPRAQSIRPADYAMVKDCAYLGEVQGSSGWGNLAASHGMQNSKNEAQEQAAQLGATHIVWVSIVGGYSPFATGKAYRCK